MDAERLVQTLRHYAEHLAEAERWDELFSLARDERFQQAQMQHCADEISLQLRTVQAALESAAKIDAASAMAEFLLIHARRLLEITQVSPLEALRKGGLDRAWELADLAESDYRVLWYLLLIWELESCGAIDAAWQTHRRLLNRPLARLPDRHQKLAGWLLGRITFWSSAYHA